MPFTFLFSLLFASPFAQVAIAAPTVQAPIVQDDSPTALRAYAKLSAKEHGLNAEHFIATIECESGFDETITGDYPDGHGHFVSKARAPKGSKPTSFGIVQIHEPLHDWGISTDTALDGRASIDIMADYWQKYGVSGAQKWSCYNNKYGEQFP